MTAAITEAATRQPDRLPAEVLAALVQEAQSGLHLLDGGCLTHDTGRASWCGLTGKVKPILFEYHFGQPVPSGSILLRQCSTPGCLEPTHHASVPRSQWGSFLGRPGGAWRPQVAWRPGSQHAEAIGVASNRAV